MFCFLKLVIQYLLGSIAFLYAPVFAFFIRSARALSEGAQPLRGALQAFVLQQPGHVAGTELTWLWTLQSGILFHDWIFTMSTFFTISKHRPRVVHGPRPSEQEQHVQQQVECLDQDERSERRRHGFDRTLSPWESAVAAASRV